MNLHLEKTTVESWAKALKKAGGREIGGVLFGEHLGGTDFRLIEATLQMTRGSAASFSRDGGSARRELKRLTRRYGNPSRFNYLGEWHSHPCAPVTPSLVDEHTMFQLLSQDKTGLNFLLLIINRLEPDGTVTLAAQACLKSGHRRDCKIIYGGVAT